MATQATDKLKIVKDKTHGMAPKLVPRQTTASAARAALVATNRNVAPPPATKPANRPQAMVNATQLKTPRNSFRSDSKSDLKTSEDTAEDSVCDSSLPEDSVNPSELTTEIDTPATISFETTVEEDPKTTEQKNSPNEESKQSPRSRPHTPGSVRSSRPNTPRLASRPQTPAVSHNSRPNTPRQQNRPKTPIHSTVSMPTHGGNNHIKEDDDLKVAFSKAQKRFHLMKKELDMKQQAVLQVFDTLRVLKERMADEGISGAGEDGVSNEELLVMNIGNWTAEEVAQMVRDSITPAATETVTEILQVLPTLDEQTISELNTKILNVPASFSELCLQAFTTRAELIDWLKSIVAKYEEKGESFDKIEEYNSQGLQLCQTLRDLKDQATEAVFTLTEVTKQACRERTALLAIGQSLVREVACLRQELEAKAKYKSNTESESVKLLVETRKDLEEERAAKSAIKEKLTNTETQLKHTRMRVAKMEKQLRESDSTIVSLTGTVKSLEEQSRLKEVSLEAKARKLRDSVKTGELNINQISHQRDALHAETVQLKEQIENMKKDRILVEKELNNTIKEMKKELADQKAITEKETELKTATEQALAQFKQEVEELKAKIIEVENSRPSPDLPTEREMELWAQLQATKDALHLTEEEVTTSKREKIRFLENLTKLMVSLPRAQETDNKAGMQQKLAAELLSKEEILGQLQIQIREMTITIKLNEQKLQQYEQYVHSLQEHNQAILNGSEDSQDLARYQNLQQEIMNLKMSVLESVNRNEELSELLKQKDQQLNHQDKTSQAQARHIKVQEGLITMLQNKEAEQSRELATLQQDLEHRMKIVDEVNKQIAAKAQEIKDLFASLESRQQQIYQLERIVLALEEQHRRAQAQRTRHEEKIAALEHKIASGCNRREKKNLFF